MVQQLFLVLLPGDVVGLVTGTCGSSFLCSWSCSPELPGGRYSRYKGEFKGIFHHPYSYSKSSCVAETADWVLQAVKLTSSRTQLPYEYYSLPFCKPKTVFYKGENLGESRDFLLIVF